MPGLRRVDPETGEPTAEAVDEFFSQSPNDSRASQQAGSPQGTQAPAPDRDKLLADHQRRVGDEVELFLADALKDNEGPVSGLYTPSTKTTKALVQVSLAALDTGDTLAHEDWHVVEDMLKEMGEQGEKVLASIHRAVSRPETIKWLAQELLARGETADSAAIGQLSNVSERAAFAFQFFTANGGKMPIAPRARNIFRALWDFLKRLAGITDDLIKAGRFFEFFDTGDFAKNMKNPESVLAALRETRRERFFQKLNESAEPLKQLAFAAFGHAESRILALNIPAYTEILGRLSKGTRDYAGFIREQRARENALLNRWARRFSGRDTLPPEEVAEFVAEVEQYRKDAGASFNTARTTLPITIDASKVEGKLKEFKQDLKAYGGLDTLSEAELEEAVNEILLKGYFPGTDTLFLHHPEKGKKWASEDTARRAFTYVKRATREAELARAFGPDGLRKLLEAGDEQATPQGRRMIRTYLHAATGDSGLTLSPEHRKLFGTVITAVNVSLLPFALFSQLTEPLQLAFRRNKLSSAVDAAFRWFRDLPRSFAAVDSGASRDQWEKMASSLGLINDAVSVSMMADMLNEVPLTGWVEKVNRMFFRYNGMEQWTRSMHVASTRLAVEFIAEHAASGPEERADHLEDLGLSPKDGPLGPDGLPDVEAPKVRAAVLRFVNEAMAHPDPSTNTLWMNDPRFALVAHLKRFTFAFAYHVNRRIWRHLKAGKYRALLPMALAVPWAIGASSLRDFVTPGPEAYKATWGVSDYVASGIERTGLTGRVSLPLDALRNLDYGGSGIESIAPSGEMTAKVLRGLNRGDWSVLLDASPLRRFIV